MKPGNLREGKVPNPAVRRKMRLLSARVCAPETRGAVFTEDLHETAGEQLIKNERLPEVCGRKKGQEHEPLLFYFRIGYRGTSR